jgi:hypothetical protein
MGEAVSEPGNPDEPIGEHPVSDDAMIGRASRGIAILERTDAESFGQEMSGGIEDRFDRPAKQGVRRRGIASVAQELIERGLRQRADRRGSWRRSPACPGRPSDRWPRPSRQPSRVLDHARLKGALDRKQFGGPAHDDELVQIRLRRVGRGDTMPVDGRKLHQRIKALQRDAAAHQA